MDKILNLILFNFPKNYSGGGGVVALLTESRSAPVQSIGNTKLLKKCVTVI